MQFGGLVAVAELNGTNVTEAFKWGRSDHPWIWCQGEILESMPDHSGGHKAGWHKHGAGMVASSTPQQQTPPRARRVYVCVACARLDG